MLTKHTNDNGETNEVIDKLKRCLRKSLSIYCKCYFNLSV